MANETKEESPKGSETAAKGPGRKPNRTRKAKPRSKRKVGLPAKASPLRAAASKRKSASRMRRKQTAPADRAKIIAAANREGLTALEVQKRFGVKPVTYYSWRKKSGLKGRRGRRPGMASPSAGGDLAEQVRAGVRGRIQEILPAIVRSEIDSYLSQVLSGARRRGRPRK